MRWRQRLHLLHGAARTPAGGYRAHLVGQLLETSMMCASAFVSALIPPSKQRGTWSVLEREQDAEQQAQRDAAARLEAMSNQHSQQPQQPLEQAQQQPRAAASRAAAF